MPCYELKVDWLVVRPALTPGIFLGNCVGVFHTDPKGRYNGFHIIILHVISHAILHGTNIGKKTCLEGRLVLIFKLTCGWRGGLVGSALD